MILEDFLMNRGGQTDFIKRLKVSIQNVLLIIFCNFYQRLMKKCYILLLIYQKALTKSRETQRWRSITTCLSGCSHEFVFVYKRLEKTWLTLPNFFVFASTCTMAPGIVAEDFFPKPCKEKQGWRLLAEHIGSPASMPPLYLPPWYESPLPSHTIGRRWRWGGWQQAMTATLNEKTIEWW